MAEVNDTLTLDTNAMDVFDKIMGALDRVMARTGAFNASLNSVSSGSGALDSVSNAMNKVSMTSDMAAVKISTLDGRFKVVSSSSQLFATSSKNVAVGIDKQSTAFNKLASAMSGAMGFLDGLSSKFKLFLTGLSINPLGTIKDSFRSFFDSASNGFGTVKKKLDELPPATKNWQMALMGVNAAINLIKMGMGAIKGALGLSDTMTQNSARLNMIVDDGGSVEELEQKIFNSALRSRSDYLQVTDVIAKLGLQTGDTFKGNDELIAFVETLNKTFVLAGTSATGIESTMYNLTQAMSSGVLRGQDLKAVMDNAQPVAQAIADYMGIAYGELRDYAAQGLITSGIVKNALAASADEITKKFEEMPKTFGQIFTTAGAYIKKAFEPAMRMLNELANSAEFTDLLASIVSGFQMIAIIVQDVVVPIIQFGLEFIANHLEHIQIILGLLGAAAVAFGIFAFTSFVIAHLPLIMIVLAIAAFIDMLVQASGTAEDVFTSIGGVVGGFGALAFNTFATIYNAIATVAEFLMNVFIDPVGSVKKLFADMASVVLDILASIAGAVDKILGTDYATGLTNLSNKASQWGQDQVSENYKKLDRMEMADVESMISKGMNIGKELSDKIGNFNMMDRTSGSGAGIGSGVPDFGNISEVGKVGSVGKIDEDVSISEEDLKLLKDIRQRDILVGLTTPTAINYNDYGDTIGYEANKFEEFLETMKDGEANVTVR